VIIKSYRSASPTIEAFHRCDAPARAIVGAVGTAKTTSALWEVGWNLPRRLYAWYGITHTRWFVVRRNYTWLMDTDLEAAMDWFTHGEYRGMNREMTIKWPRSASVDSELVVDLDFRAAETDEDEKKFRSTAATGAWIDEAIELRQVVKDVIISRLGRYPKVADSPSGYVPHYLVETTNPFPSDLPMYWLYRWVGPTVLQQPEMGDGGVPKWETGKYDTSTLVSRLPPGPVPPRSPIKGFVGFWQPTGENAANLRPGYFRDLKAMYPESKEMQQMLVDAKPGYRPEGKGVYRNYDQDVHMARQQLDWSRVENSIGEKIGAPVLVGWDNSGTNNIAAVIVQHVGPMQYQVLREFYHDRMNLLELTGMVMECLAHEFAGAKVQHWGDPAGFAMHASISGNTSNAQMQMERFGITIQPSEQNLTKRISAVDELLARRNGLLIDPRCTRLLNGFFGGYVYEERPSMGILEFKAEPKDNKFTHVHDALQYALVPSVYPMIVEPRPDITQRSWDLARAFGGGRTEEEYSYTGGYDPREG